jgi:Ni/Co efflux regulator RcnB
MAITKVLAGASLLLLALVAAPVANAQNDGDGTTVTHPHRVVDPAKKAARQAKRKHRREIQRQMQQQQGAAPIMRSGPMSN